MQYVKVKDKQISVFTLGTVQLGMRYGLGVFADKPTTEGAFTILDRAMELGVNTLDTANNYGDSEQVIGQWLKKRSDEGKEKPQIVTKIGPLDHSSFQHLRDDILRQTDGCREALGMETLDCLMLHDYEDYANDQDNVRSVFEELKAQKAYGLNAISAYSYHDYSILANSGFDAVQIPQNIFDWRQIENGGIQKLADAGMMIFVRSVFLQGLVFHKPEDLDPRMDFCFPYLREFHRICQDFGLEPAVLALSFVLSLQGVTSTVLGCDTVHHVETNCDLMGKTVQLSGDQMEVLHKAFGNIDVRVLNPGCWYNHG